MNRLGLSLGTFVCTGAFLWACGGGDTKVNYPTTDAGGGAVTNQDGAQVGIVDGETSGLTGSARAAYDRGWKAWLDADLPEAKKAFQEAVEAAPKSPAPHYSLGVVLEHLGKLSEAQQEYRAAFTAKEDHELSICAYGLSLAGAGHAGEADTFFTDQIGKHPKSARVATCRAEAKSLAKDHATAQLAAQDALRLDPDFKPAMVAVARDHYRARKMQLANYALQAILDGFGDANPPRDKDNAEAHLVRGLIQRENGSRIVALKDFEAAVAKRPDMVEALVNLGSMRLEAGNAQEALPVLERATKYAPNHALAHLNLGDCYRLLGRTAEAKREMEQALALDSTLAAAHYDLGLLFLFSPSVPGFSAADQVAQAIKELETYKTMRGAKAPPGANDDVDDLIARAKAKQNEQKNAVAAQQAAAAAPPPAAPAADAGAPAADAAKK